MDGSTFRRWLAVLTFGFVGASMTFMAGARAGAALNGRVNGLTFANAPLPSIETVQTPVEGVTVANE